MIYIVCYDISNHRERYALSKTLKAYGHRVQRSVFEVRIRSAAEVKHLQTKLHALTDEPAGIRFYRLCQNCRQDSRQLDGEAVAQFKHTYII